AETEKIELIESDVAESLRDGKGDTWRAWSERVWLNRRDKREERERERERMRMVGKRVKVFPRHFENDGFDWAHLPPNDS
ncbi:hypothetical protein TorRG33x02_263870, partial [Trema orientale]